MTFNTITIDNTEILDSGPHMEQPLAVTAALRRSVAMTEEARYAVR